MNGNVVIRICCSLWFLITLSTKLFAAPDNLDELAHRPWKAFIYSYPWTAERSSAMDAILLRTTPMDKKVLDDPAEAEALLREFNAISWKETRVPQDLRLVVDILSRDGRIITFTADRFRFYNVDKRRSVKMNPALQARLLQLSGQR